MGAVKFKLSFEAEQTLELELGDKGKFSINCILLGEKVPAKVTKVDLVSIVKYLCEKLNWIEKQEDPELKDDLITEDIEFKEEQMTEDLHPQQDNSEIDPPVANTCQLKQNSLVIKTEVTENHESK